MNDHLLRFGARAAVASTILTLLASSGCSEQEPAIEIPEVETTTADPAFVESLTRATRSVAASPHAAATWGELGMVLLAHEHHAAAAKALARAEALDRANARWPYLLALSLLDGEPDPDRALNALARASRIAPHGAAAMRHAEELLRLARIDEASTVLDAVSHATPAGADANLARREALRGRLHLARGDEASARDALETSIRAAPRMRSTRALLAEVLFRLDDREGAERERRASEKLSESDRWPDPDRDELERRATGILARLDRASGLFRSGQTDTAIATLEGLVAEPRLASHPNLVLAKLLLGRLLLETANVQRAIEVLGAATEAHPESFEARFELGSAYERRGDRDLALAAYREALRLKRDYAPAWHGVARGAYLAGDRRAARDALREAIRIRPEAAATRKDLGRVLAELGEFDEATRELERAQALAPDDASIRQLLDAARDHRAAR